MNQVENEAESEKAKIGRIATRVKVGCLVLLLLGASATLIAIGTLEYRFFSAYVGAAPWEIAGGKSYVYRSGFGDVSCNYYVSSDAAPDELYLMATGFTDSPHGGAFLISTDGKLAVTESDMNTAERSSFNAGTRDIESDLLYTHAFDVETMEYIKPEDNARSEGEAEHRTRHEVISKLLDAHGGIGAKFTLSRDSIEMRRLGCWEWRRWRKMVSAAHERRPKR